MNKSKTKKRNSVNLYARKLKPTVNELSWLDQHEQEARPPVYSGKRNPQLKISKLHQPSRPSNSHDNWFTWTPSGRSARIHLHGASEPPYSASNVTVIEPDNEDELSDYSSSSYEVSESYASDSADSDQDDRTSESQSVLTQFGTIDYLISSKEEASEVLIRFRQLYTDENYALVITNQHPDFYATIQTKWQHAALIHITRLRPSDACAASLNWISSGNRASIR